MIDVHTHVVPPGLPFGSFAGDLWPRVEVDGDRAEVYTGAVHFRSVTSAAWDLERRAEEMDAARRRTPGAVADAGTVLLLGGCGVGRPRTPAR